MPWVTILNPIRVAFLSAGLAMLILILVTSLARAHVIQIVESEFRPGTVGTPPPATFRHADVFKPTSGDISTNILASIGGPITSTNSPGYFGSASAGIFGDVGLNAQVFGVGPGSSVSSTVEIGSDEFVNALGVPVHLATNFIVDGGSIRDLFSTNTTVTFSLEVGAKNLGPVGPESDKDIAASNAGDVAALGGVGGFFPGYVGGSYYANYSVDANGNRSFSEVIKGGLDLNASFNPTPGPTDMNVVVEIPLSFQTLDLLTLDPGDRLLIGYRASYGIIQNGVSEGIFADYSDPLMLSGNALRGTLVVTPLDPVTDLPGPASLPLFADGLLLLFVARRRG